MPDHWLEVLRPDMTPVRLPPSGGVAGEVSVLAEASPDGSISVSVRASASTRAAIRVGTTLPCPGHPFWLIPGCFYGANRLSDCERRYPRFDANVYDPAGMVSPTWEFRQDRVATRSVMMWTLEAGRALTGLRNSRSAPESYGFAQRDGLAEVWVTVPYREEPITYVGRDVPEPADRQWLVLGPEEGLDVTVQLHPLAPDRHSYAPLLRAVRDSDAVTDQTRPWVGVEQAAVLAAYGLHRWHYDPDPGVLLEAVPFDRALTAPDGGGLDRQAMHVGWVSGIPWAHALLRAGERLGSIAYSRAAARVIDTVCDAISPSGTFYGVWYRDGGWKGSWTPLPRGVHARTLGEAALFLQRSIERFPLLSGSHPQWEQALQSNLKAFMERQGSDGNLGAVHDHDSGRVLSWRGSAGLIWIAVFAEHYIRCGDDASLRAAVLAGDHYASYVTNEFIHGAPEDVDLAPTSEDGYSAVIAYLALHRATGKPRWLELARRAADWTLTFRYSWNVTFPRHTILSTYDYRTRGGDQASSSNQHLHNYGLVCHRELLALTEATGDRHYEEQAAQHLAWARQLIARVDGDFNARRGMVSERAYQTNCFEPKGSLLTLSHAWCVGALLLACEDELERVYARTAPSLHRSGCKYGVAQAPGVM